MVTKAMFAELRRAVTAVRDAEADLARVQGSFGWNQQYEKVAVAERAYDTALRAIEEGSHDEDSTRTA